MLRRGRKFERAVYEFVRALDPSAEVLFDQKVADRTTRRHRRQVDVWVNASLGGHIPTSLLVSCKDQKRKVTVTQMGAFVDEVRSTGANTGVMYSSSGFSEAALAKAKWNRLTCCRLYQNQPADVPQVLFFSSYLCDPQVRIELLDPIHIKGVDSWNDLFDLRMGKSDPSRTVLDELAEGFREQEKVARDTCLHKRNVPSDWALMHSFSGDEDPGFRLRIKVTGHWKWYRGRVEAHYINGSYCFTNEDFRGTQAGPSIDMKGRHPGSGWELMHDAPKQLSGRHVLCIRYGGDFRGAARSSLGNNPLPPVDPRGDP